MSIRTNIKQKLVGGILLLATIVSCKNSTPKDDTTMNTFQWSTLDTLPDAFGFAGGFSGISNNALLFAGGANFPDGLAPWSGGVKKWYNHIYVLENTDAKWKRVNDLPIPLGYGVSVTYKNSLIVIGGSNEDGHSNEVFSLTYQNENIQIDTLPKLPITLANSCGAVVNDVIYVAGGLIQDKDKNTSPVFLSLDMNDIATGWKTLETYPGKSRMLSVAGVYNDQFILLSGVTLVDGTREYLMDAYTYSPTKGWDSLPSLPYSVAAAPSYAYTHQNKLFVFGGDNGELAPKAGELKENHPGFDTQILSYDFNSKEWSVQGNVYTDIKENAPAVPNESTWAPVTTNLVIWNDVLIIPSGEVRPAIRTPKVLIAKFQ